MSNKLDWLQPAAIDGYKAISTRDLRQNLAAVLNYTTSTKDRVLLTRNGAEQAAIVSVEELLLLDFLEKKVSFRDVIQAVARNRGNVELAWDKIKDCVQSAADDEKRDVELSADFGPDQKDGNDEHNHRIRPA